jgi:hypothetical protein
MTLRRGVRSVVRKVVGGTVRGGVAVATVDMAAGIVPMAVVAVTAAHALERHDEKTGDSEDQRECVQVHVSIEAFEGQPPGTSSRVRDGPLSRYAGGLLFAGKCERRRTA